ncbi:LacI family transcriptional regulator [Sphingobacterium sp. SRCM116780]|uniref:LacI family DNA-binding transcriptional regulator n=1 Tax=Sphingobacterium sp. SRCM116780 TaxID=2907623 RepID=UPI001F310771|nr:LacI family DNA-binding transcriptional regulator [Sphingobacterium sp. SRCM116780]UIR54986.1 LacI family transcriptional regulator [Sphingobacterium sp. SRCM116780]
MSINEIAKYLKVSKSTVSLVINGKAEQGRISKTLEKRILDYVEQIGYKPNALAKSLATGKSHTIGLIVENIGDSFFGPIALYIEAYLRVFDYHVLYSSTMGDSRVASTIIDTMLEKKVEGIILAPTQDLVESVNKIVNSQVPLVIFDRNIPEVEVNYVGTNNYEASREACLHLLGRDFKNVGMVTINSVQPQMAERRKAYEDLLKEKRISTKILSVPFENYKSQAITEIRAWLKKNPDLDAIYFTTNYLCIAGLKAIEMCKTQNKQYGVIAFDDHDLFDLMNPPISCIHQPLELLAKHTVDLLLQQINDGSSPISKIIIPSNLIVRNSSC